MASNINTGFAKCFISFMAIVILLQGCIYLALPIYGIIQEGCQKDGAVDISSNPFDFVMRLIYFQSESCGNPKVSVPTQSEEFEIQMVWSKSFDITNRNYIFLITYAVVSALWIATSLLVLASMCGPVTNSVASISFWPWFSIVIGGCILDGVATGYYISDIVHTTTVQDTFTYIGADTTNQNLMDILENFEAYFVTPAIVMACLSSRLVVIWLLNIFGTAFCLSLSHVLAKNSGQVPVVTGEQRVSEESIGNNIVIENSRQPEERPNQVTLQTTLSEPLATPLDNTTPISQVPVRQLSSASTPNDGDLSKPSQSNNTTYRNTDTHPDRLDYPGTNIASISAILPLEKVSHFSTETPLNSRYTNAETSQLSNQRVSAELRSQLPWSYTSALGKPQVPPKPQRPLYPDIPEPDYTA